MARQTTESALLMAGLGTHIRSAFSRADANFVELYGFLGGLAGFDDGRIAITDADGLTTDAGLTYDAASNVLGVLGTIELGHATDTTLARTAAGRITVEAVAIVRGPGSATDNAIARYDGATGDLLQGSSVLISDTNSISGVVDLSITGVLNVDGTQVLRERITGWTAPTGTDSRAGYATASATLNQVSQTLKALIDDLMTHGLIGA